MRTVFVVALLVSCQSAPTKVLANDAKAEGVEAKTRRSTVKDGKVAWEVS